MSSLELESHFMLQEFLRQIGGEMAWMKEKVECDLIQVVYGCVKSCIMLGESYSPIMTLEILEKTASAISVCAK